MINSRNLIYTNILDLTDFEIGGIIYTGYLLILVGPRIKSVQVK